MASPQQDWPYPGSRWWKFEFHTHTPASADTFWAQPDINLSPEEWLLRYMAAEIDCVAITDHNNGAWVDVLKVAYEEMREQADKGSPPEGFRALTLFPGVEISVQGGFHLLAILDPETTTSDIDTLLGQVRYDGTKGDSDGVTRKGAGEVVCEVRDAGGIPIPAHADRQGESGNGKGLLAVRAGTRQLQLDANTVRQVLDTECLLAIEWEDMEKLLPKHVEKQARKLTRVLGSDSHSFQGMRVPGSRYTWVKMAKPTLEGLRLALLDGNEISIRRSDDTGEFDPFRKPIHFITGIEVESARFMGVGTTTRLAATPYFNALIGGRGTGKSTIVHALRLAYRRDRELQHWGIATEPHRQFKRFKQSVKGRTGDGGVRDATEIRVAMMREGVEHILRWRHDTKGNVVEERDANGRWQSTASQAVNPERFPIRLLSQGQIAAMAGESRQALLDVIDDAADVAGLHRAFEDAKNTYWAQCARLRELGEKIAGRPEVERKLEDSKRKLEALTQSDHSVVLKSHQQALRQHREIDTILDQLGEMPGYITSVAEDLLLDDWPDGVFDAAQDGDVLAWRREADRLVATTRVALARSADTLTDKVQQLRMDERLSQWRQRVEKAGADYEALQTTLADQGLSDPQDFGRLEQERQNLEVQLKQLDQLRLERDGLDEKNKKQWQRVLQERKAITQARAEFVAKTLETNTFVKIEVVGFGFESRHIEHSLREVIEVTDDRFEHDILREEGGTPIGGLAFDIAQNENREAALDAAKQRLIENCADFRGQFRNYIERKHEKPEFADHIQCWFPEDDLRIEYSRQGDGSDWSSITQGSQGQRSAALLAFLLAFGDEPLVLDQPEDDLDNHLIYDLVVRQIRDNKLRRQLIIVTHNPNVLINGDAEMVHAFDFRGGQCRVIEQGALQEKTVREEVCRVMEGGREAFARRWERLGREV